MLKLVIMMLLSLVALPCLLVTGGIGQEDFKSQASGAILDPSQATRQIQKALTGTQIQEPVSPTVRKLIQEIVNRIDWSKASIQGYSSVLATMESPEQPYVETEALRASVGLVCAAWDVHKGRPQAVLGISALACPIKSVKLISGSLKIGAGLRVSSEWPWETSTAGLTLREFVLAYLGGSIRFSLRDYPDLWNRSDLRSPLDRN